MLCTLLAESPGEHPTCNQHHSATHTQPNTPNQTLSQPTHTQPNTQPATTQRAAPSWVAALEWKFPAETSTICCPSRPTTSMLSFEPLPEGLPSCPHLLEPKLFICQHNVTRFSQNFVQSVCDSLVLVSSYSNIPCHGTNARRVQPHRPAQSWLQPHTAPDCAPHRTPHRIL